LIIKDLKGQTDEDVIQTNRENDYLLYFAGLPVCWSGKLFSVYICLNSGEIWEDGSWVEELIRIDVLVNERFNQSGNIAKNRSRRRY